MSMYRNCRCDFRGEMGVMRKILVLLVLMSGLLVGCKNDIDEPYQDPVHVRSAVFRSDDHLNSAAYDSSRSESVVVFDGLEWYDDYSFDSFDLKYDSKSKVSYYGNLLYLCVAPNALDRVMSEILPGACVRGCDSDSMRYLVELPDNYDSYDDILDYCDAVYDLADQKDDVSRDLAYYVVSVQPVVVNE